MNRNLLIGAISLMAGSLLAADAGAKDTVSNAIKKLADQGNYSWKSTTDSGGGGGGGRFGGPTMGKTEKGGATLLTMTRGENTVQAVIKGEKGAIKTDEGWQSLADAAEAGGGGGGGRGGGRFLARTLQNYQLPAAQAQDLIGKVKDIKMTDGAYVGELTQDGAASLLRFGRGGGRQGGGAGPEVSGAKGSVKFWVKDGMLSKYETKVQGTMSFNGNDRDIDRTTTVEIQEVGSTKVEVPAEARTKIS